MITWFVRHFPHWQVVANPFNRAKKETDPGQPELTQPSLSPGSCKREIPPCSDPGRCPTPGLVKRPFECDLLFHLFGYTRICVDFCGFVLFVECYIYIIITNIVIIIIIIIIIVTIATFKMIILGSAFRVS